MSSESEEAWVLCSNNAEHEPLKPTGERSKNNKPSVMNGNPSAPIPMPSRPSQPGSINSLDSCLMDEFLTKNSPVLTERFQMSDIIRNPSLAKAARREMDGQVPTPEVASTPGSLTYQPDVDGHELEIERQRASVSLVDKEVQEESRVNKEMSQLIIERLQGSAIALEEMLKLVSGWVSAEQAYTTGLTLAAKANPVGPCDSEGMQATGKGIGTLLNLVGQAHAQLQQSLSSACNDIKDVVNDYKGVVKEITNSARSVQQGIHDCRRQMHMALDEHAHICAEMDNLAIERVKGRSSRVLDQDPWATEGVLAQLQQKLKNYQDMERSFLKEAFHRAEQLELRRIQVIQSASHVCLSCYTATLLPILQDLSSFQDSLQSVDVDDELRELREVGRSCIKTSEELAERQEEVLVSVCQELFCSPEIVRQGTMWRWNGYSSDWIQCHFVLTRAGFLHWFRSCNDVKPVDALNLARCDILQGEAPIFNILEKQSLGLFFGMKSRKLTFKANNIEDCCEWAIALREAIAAASGK